MAWKRGKFAFVTITLQVVFVVLFAIFVEYDTSANAKDIANSLSQASGGAAPGKNMVSGYYAMFQDVHVMIFVGFGFLMTFLKRYGYSALSFNMLISAFVLQWATLMSGFLHLHNGKILVNITTMLTSDFAAAAVLISFGAVLGKTSPFQLIIVALLEIVFFQVNEWIGVHIYKAVDIGGSMFVHTFGAYFGLAMARVIYKKDVGESQKEGSNYHSDIFSMIGTIFLWMFWPSFNSAMAPGDDQHRAVLNTYFALASCCVVSFAISSLVNKEDKFDMVHIQNATLAGGVAVGTTADMMINPWGALVIGALAGTLSVVGYAFLTPFMNTRLKIHDTCGVNNLHGMPGVFAGIAGAIVTALATEHDYGLSLYQIFPARAPIANSTLLAAMQKNLTIDAGLGRTAGQQAGYQMVALATTLGIAMLGGIVTGCIIRIPCCDQPRKENLFDDTTNFEVPDEGFVPLLSSDKFNEATIDTKI